MTNRLQFHNTMTREKTDFEPLDANNIRVYVCGPTVYDYAHIGNARPVVVFDVLVRLLRIFYPTVTYVRNITDVEDKINARALENGESIVDLTTRTAKIFHEDMAALGALPPDYEPRATNYIDEMIEMIKTLIDKGHAYEAEGHVLFSVSSMAGYGQLSKRARDEMIAGARVEIAPYKKDAADFVLWKPSNPEQPGWDSPWGPAPGRGRPGWHIECSAMSKAHLGNTFDIHGGGQDLIFPHHENEIAQSCCANGTDDMAKLWMHNGYLMSEGEKMSKSLGNFYTVHDLLDEFPGEAIRLLLLKTHYRKPQDFTKDGLFEARTELDGFYSALRKIKDIKPTAVTNDVLKTSPVSRALSNELNTSFAIHELHKLLASLNIQLSRGNAKEEDLASTKGHLLAQAKLLGLLGQAPDDWFNWSAPGGDAVDGSDIDQLVNERLQAKNEKDFKTADEIRDRLQAMGVIVEDGAGGSTWRRG